MAELSIAPPVVSSSCGSVVRTAWIPLESGQRAARDALGGVLDRIDKIAERSF
ncbi:hypothetical protein GCM10010215_29560 [Streptomyces virginiae]|uniref:IclR-ED domain-containing protein n=1 Tax=Streptomyces virginiae TaxID=1961 RepID=A0ABQ3NFV8_STRVG|nr:hypothetical protein GCM10010215_29560 [Streptomyces virginiae]GHI11671.1 hypothetical protein Scinn_11340 [Streptomyces virginiae]GLV93662.1 hypothetical protein Slala04_51160 [Streptomyces lavendulae subsp. lavendulae]